MRPVTFKVEAKLKNGRGRAGTLHTPHGDIQTPAFVGVATKATVKGVATETLKELGLQTIIANTYHLYLSPGEEIVERAGGVGKFMRWEGPTMTDSGGFQVFSLGSGFGKKVSKFGRSETTPLSLDEPFQEGCFASAQTEQEFSKENGLEAKAATPPGEVHLATGGVAAGAQPPFRKKILAEATLYDAELATSHGKLAIVDEDGVTFTSHLNGDMHRFTPERSVEIQHKLGADIFFAFDECTEPTASYEYQKAAMERTHRWAKRSLAAHRQNIDANNRQAIYGIGQGGQFDDLRQESAHTIGDMGFDGFGLGGSFSKKYGEHSLQSALNMLDYLPSDMPVHGLGVGEPEDIFLGAEYGVDTFDCVIPTRNGRSGTVFTENGPINIENRQYIEDFSPLDPECGCPVCAPASGAGYTKAYIHHLFRSKEMLAPMLASQHNIYFLAHLTERIRLSILDGSFETFRDSFLKKYKK